MNNKKIFNHSISLFVYMTPSSTQSYFNFFNVINLKLLLDKIINVIHIKNIKYKISKSQYIKLFNTNMLYKPYSMQLIFYF